MQWQGSYFYTRQIAGARNVQSPNYSRTVRSEGSLHGPKAVMLEEEAGARKLEPGEDERSKH